MICWFVLRRKLEYHHTYVYKLLSEHNNKLMWNCKDYSFCLQSFTNMVLHRYAFGSNITEN